MSDRLQNNVDPKLRAHNRIIKGTTYSVASVLAVLMLTAGLPPLVADQSDRAILDAPVTLLTSPIAGEVASMNAMPGEVVASGAPMAEIKNLRVDQTTLMDLKGKAADFRQSLTAAQSKATADVSYLASLDAEIEAQKARLLVLFEKQNAELQGKASSAAAIVEEKRALRDRQVNMVARDVASNYMLKPTTQELSSAQAMYDAAAASLAANSGQIDAIKHNIFVGDNLVGISTLAQKRRDIAFDLERQKIEEAQAKSGLATETALVDAENSRVKSLSHARLSATEGGEVLRVGAAVGRHVNPGDSLATFVNCKGLFAVAIFSYRQAAALPVGARVTISGPGIATPQQGHVQDVIPKASDKTEELYAVSFPQTERREMYVIVKPDGDNALLRTKDENNEPRGSCPVGKWVTVTRADGWVPSASIVWHDASAFLSNSVSALFMAHSAEARQREQGPS